MKLGGTRRRLPLVALLAASALCCGGTSGMCEEEFNYDEAKVPPYTLPDVLTAEDGTVIDSVDLWTTKRRPELLRQFEEHVFGTLPQIEVTLRTKVRSENPSALDGAALRREVTVYFSDEDDGPKMDLLIYTPAKATGPVPTFLGYNFNGNHAVESDPSLHLTDAWMRENDELGVRNHRATEQTRGSESSRWPVATIVNRGYGLVTIYYGDVDPDFDDGFKNGIHALVKRSDAWRRDDEGGSISAWAWGLSRALDVLEADPRIDASRVAVIGHSRLGKTSLWAGANDPRFAMVISNNSGCGGAALSKRNFGETVARINTVFPHWFCLNHRKYNDNEQALPVDHHMLIALSAPRPVYVASAVEDTWADPYGEYLGLFHASPVYRLFGKKTPTSEAMPEIDQPILEDVGYHVRTGKHDVTDYDWEQYLEFADRHLR